MQCIYEKIVICFEVIFIDYFGSCRINFPIAYASEKVKFEKFRTKKVRSSTGYQQERYFVELGIVLFDKEIITDFSLTKRNGLRNPILLGRKLLNKNFVIDTCFTNLSFRKKQQTLRKIKDTL